MSALGFAIAFLTLGQQWLMTQKTWWAPLSGVALQGLWIWYTAATGQDGILFLSVAYAVLYAASIRRWSRERN